jgi:hypothetical protein
VKAAVNGPEATALGASSAFKNEASAGLRRASVSGRRWRGAVANKRRQVRDRAAQRAALGWRSSVWSLAGPLVLTRRGSSSAAGGGRQAAGEAHSTPSPLDPKPTQPQRAAASQVHAHCTLQIRASPASQYPNGPLPACRLVTLCRHAAFSHPTTWRVSHWLRTSAPSPVTNPGGAALAHRGTPGYCNPL